MTMRAILTFTNIAN